MNVFKSLVEKCRHNFIMKLISLILAIIVWLVVVAYYNPQTTNTISDLPITVVYDDSFLQEQGLVLVTELDQTVDVKIEGRREQLALIGKDKVSATVSVSSVTKPGEYQLPVNIAINGQSVSTIHQTVQNVTLKFEKSMVTQFTVEAITIGEVAENQVLESTVNPTVVTVSGPESVINSIKTVQAVVEQKAFTETGVYDAAIVYLDENDKKIDDKFLNLETETVKVNVMVYEEKTVPLQVDIVNSAGGNDAGYLTAVIEPETIHIAGSSAALDSINNISVGSIDVSKLEKDYSETMSVIIPNGIKNMDDLQTAKVTIGLSNTVTRTFELSGDSILLENLNNGVKATVADSSVKITVRGQATDVEKLKATDLTVVADCKSQTLSKGNNRLTAYVKFPADYKVGAVGDYKITVKVS